MAIALSWQVKSSYAGFGGSCSTAFTGLPTGVPVVIAVVYETGSAVPNFSSFSLATDAISPTDTTALISPVAGKGAVFLYFPSITTANQNLTFTNSGTYVEGLAHALTVTGHDTSAPFGRESTDSDPSTSLDFTFDTTGDAILVHFWGSTSSGIAPTEGTWAYGTGDVGIQYWSANLTAGTKAISVSSTGQNSAALVEIKAASGGATTKPWGYYAQL